ncbi:MAG: hypothetical protein HZB76_06570 [Chlamydiae bacterium]|nr:hypothetical protein [Chlamydiota bacterium]
MRSVEEIQFAYRGKTIKIPYEEQSNYLIRKGKIPDFVDDFDPFNADRNAKSLTGKVKKQYPRKHADSKAKRHAREILRNLSRAEKREQKYSTRFEEEPVETSLRRSDIDLLTLKYPEHTEKLNKFNEFLEKLIIIFSNENLTVKESDEVFVLFKKYLGREISPGDLFDLMNIIEDFCFKLDTEWCKDLEDTHEEFIQRSSRAKPYLSTKEKELIHNITELEIKDKSALEKRDDLIKQLNESRPAEIYLAFALLNYIDQLISLKETLTAVANSRSNIDLILDAVNMLSPKNPLKPTEIHTILAYLLEYKNETVKIWNDNFEKLYQSFLAKTSDPSYDLLKTHPMVIQNLRNYKLRVDKEMADINGFLEGLAGTDFADIQKLYISRHKEEY